MLTNSDRSASTSDAGRKKIWGGLSLLVALLASVCAIPSAAAQTAEGYTLQGRLREATAGFHMTDHLKPVGTEGGNQRSVSISVTKPKGERLHGSVVIHRYDCDSGDDRLADCDDLGSFTTHTLDLTLRMRTDKSKATLVGTIDLGSDIVDVELVMEDSAPVKLIRSRERIDQLDTFTIVQTRTVEYEAKESGTIAGVDIDGGLVPGMPLISSVYSVYSESRIRVTSNEITDDIPPDS